MTATHEVTHEVAGTNGAGHGDAVGPDALVERLRSQATRYHSEHDFHVRMNAGELSPAQIRGWVANRFCYQEAIPRKDAAILGNCPDREIRQRWIRRITDHDGDRDAPRAASRPGCASARPSGSTAPSCSTGGTSCPASASRWTPT